MGCCRLLSAQQMMACAWNWAPCGVRSSWRVSCWWWVVVFQMVRRVPSSSVSLAWSVAGIGLVVIAGCLSVLRAARSAMPSVVLEGLRVGGLRVGGGAVCVLVVSWRASVLWSVVHGCCRVLLLVWWVLGLVGCGTVVLCLLLLACWSGALHVSYGMRRRLSVACSCLLDLWQQARGCLSSCFAGGGAVLGGLECLGERVQSSSLVVCVCHCVAAFLVLSAMTYPAWRARRLQRSTGVRSTMSPCVSGGGHGQTLQCSSPSSSAICPGSGLGLGAGSRRRLVMPCFHDVVCFLP